MAHQMVIAKRDMYDVLNFSNIITIYKTKYIIFSLISPHQQVSLTDTGSGTVPYAINPCGDGRCVQFDSTDVQLYNRVSCEDYITRFKEVCSKSNNIREQFAFV